MALHPTPALGKYLARQVGRRAWQMKGRADMHACMHACTHSVTYTHYITLHYITLHYIHTYTYVHTYAVVSRIGLRFAFGKVENWSKFSFFFWGGGGFFLSSCCRENENGKKGPPKKVNIDHFKKSKTGPSMLRNILGPIFDF